mmetsp:Transcript_53990/g.96692  ORF Transcript_53990/g.96692 Transcript_53990/m.96692 type:complete len:549 (+) Transcript_53990:38-1684(+)
MTHTALVLALISGYFSYYLAVRVTESESAHDALLTDDSQPQTTMSDLRSLHLGQDVLIPVLGKAMTEYSTSYSLKSRKGSSKDRGRQIWQLTKEADTRAEDKVAPFAQLLWFREESLDGNGDGTVGYLYNVEHKLVLQIRRLNREPSANPEWVKPDGCKKRKPRGEHVFCLHGPSAKRSDPCLFTIFQSSYALWVYKTSFEVNAGQAMVGQAAYSQNSIDFHTNACPGFFDENTNPLGAAQSNSDARMIYYQQVSQATLSDEFNDIGLFLVLSSISVQFDLIKPHSANSLFEDPDFQAAVQKSQAELTPTFAADDIPKHAFVFRLVNQSWQLGIAQEALVPKMVMPSFDGGNQLEYVIHRVGHGKIEWSINDNQEEWSIARLDWDQSLKPKRMVVQSLGKPIFWIKQSGEPKGSQEWHIPEGCHSKRRPKAYSNRFFCIVPPDTKEDTPCMYTFQKNKYGPDVFVFRGPEMLYQMHCSNGSNFCWFSSQNCPGSKHMRATRAHWEITHPGTIHLTVFPGQDTGLFLTIASMILHKDKPLPKWWNGDLL